MAHREPIHELSDAPSIVIAVPRQNRYYTIVMIATNPKKVKLFSYLLITQPARAVGLR